MAKQFLAIMMCLLFVIYTADAKGVNEVRFYPGQTVPQTFISDQGVDAFFLNISIPDTIFALMQGKTYGSGCTVPRAELRYIQCLHRDAHGRSIVGEMILNVRIADVVLRILRQLYDAGYPIERMRLPDYWNAQDELQMRDNNSSAFNFRYISHTTTISKHGRGLAVDINPLYNPYHKRLRNGTVVVKPSTATPYLDRTKAFPYKIQKGDLCYRLFTQNGFVWGGDWNSIKDYQHFEYK